MRDKSDALKPKKLNKGKAALYVLLTIIVVFSLSIVIVHANRKNPDEIYKKNTTLRIEVLNGCAVERLALKTTDVLRELGFNVVKIGNARDDTYKETVIIERSNDRLENARYLAQQIGCRNIGKDIDRALYVDVTIIVGEDYRRIFPNVDKKL